MKILLLSILCLIAACADTKLLALEKDAQTSGDIRDYDDAAHYLANKSGVIAICRAALDIEKGRHKGYREEHCSRVLRESDKIKMAAMSWLTATESQQEKWFKRNPYEFRDMLNAIKDYDIIIRYVNDSKQ
jgi:hypothetical protein